MATFLNNFRTGETEKHQPVQQSDYDRALIDAAKAKSAEERVSNYQQAEDLLGDVPAIPVYHYVRTHPVKTVVADLRRMTQNGLFHERHVHQKHLGLR